MKPAERPLSKRLAQVRRYLTTRSDPVRTSKTLRASDIILGITLVFLAFVLLAAFVSQAFSSAWTEQNYRMAPYQQLGRSGL